MKKTPASTTQTGASNVATKPSVTQSLKDLLTAGVSQKCTFDQGTVLLSAGKFRADINTTVSGKTSQMHMINDGQFTYIWGADLPQGMKMKIDATAANADSSKYFDTNAKANYNCAPTVSAATDFAPPANVTFMDLTATQQMMPKTNGTGYYGACLRHNFESQ